MSYPPEPWHVKSHPDANITLIGNDKGWVFYLTHNDEFLPEIQEANARRIVACVNACEGIPTEALEDGAVKQLVEVLQHCKETLESNGLIRLRRAYENSLGGVTQEKGPTAYQRACEVLLKLKGEAMSPYRAEKYIYYHYGLGEVLSDVYDEDEFLQDALSVLIPAFEYPDFQHKTIGEILDYIESAREETDEC
jgi:hypothetical protein